MNYAPHKLLMVLGMLLLCLPASFAQYIQNGSFENLSACPDCHNIAPNTGSGGVYLASGWSTVTGTPDLFNSCYTPPLGGSNCLVPDVPNNFTGFGVNAQDGDGYVGAIADGSFTPDGEYFQYALDAPLVAGETYKASMYVRRAPNCGKASNNLGMHFSQTPLSLTNGTLLTPSQAQVLETNVVIDAVNWTLVENTFIASGGEAFVTIGLFSGFTTQIIDPQGPISGLMAGSYYLYDDVSICKDPDADLDPTFTVDLNCKDGQIGINASSNTQCGNSLFELFETSSPCTQNACLIQPPVATVNGYDADFLVPYSADKYYVIIHTVWDDCRPAVEERQLIQLPDYQGSISSPTPICENLDVIVTPNNIFPDFGQQWTLRVEGIVPGSTQGINPKVYYGCGTPAASIDLSDPAGSGLYNSPQNCFFPGIPNGTPYNFSCDEFCSYYRITLNYQTCGVRFSAQTTVHLICGPEIISQANPGVVCPGDPVTYSVWDPSTGQPNPLVIYNWYNGNGFVNNGAVSGPHPYDPADGGYYVEASGSNGCISTSQPLLGIYGDCDDVPVGLCQADFSTQTFWGIDGNCYVTFNESSTPASDIISWNWDFGDQTTSSLQNPPTKVYPSGQLFNVCLTIGTDGGCTNTYCEQVGCTFFVGGGDGKGKKLGENDFSFSLYPNPTSEAVTLDYDIGSLPGAKVELIDMTGRVVSRSDIAQASGTQKIDLHSLTNGIYIVQVQKEGVVFFREKLVVNQ